MTEAVLLILAAAIATSVAQRIRLPAIPILVVTPSRSSTSSDRCRSSPWRSWSSRSGSSSSRVD